MAEKPVLVLAFVYKIAVKSGMLHPWFMIIWAHVIETEKGSMLKFFPVYEPKDSILKHLARDGSH